MSTPIKKSDVLASQWNDICARLFSGRSINGAHAHANGAWNYNSDPRQPEAGMQGDTTPRWTRMLEGGRAVARHFANVTYALYGISGNRSPAYSAYAYFYVDPNRHATHYNNVINAINSYAPGIPAAGMSLAQVRDAYTVMSNHLINNLHAQVPDLRVCHGSCHSSCHNSRGRR